LLFKIHWVGSSGG